MGQVSGDGGRDRRPGSATGPPSGELRVVPGADPRLIRLAFTRLLDDAPVGYAILDADLRYVLINDRLAEMNGHPVEDHLGRTMHDMIPDVAATAEAAFREVARTGRPLRELDLSGQVPSMPGVQRHWVESVYPLQDADGTCLGLAVLVWEITDRVREQQERARLLAAERAAVEGARAAAGRTRILQELTAALAGTVTVQDLGEVVVGPARERLGARSAVLLGYDGGSRLEVLAAHGGPAELAVGTDLPLGADSPLALAVRRDRQVRVPAVPPSPDPPGAVPFGPDPARPDAPDPSAPDPATPSCLVLPLHGGRQVIGALGFGWDDRQEPGTADPTLVTALADQCAVALDRARLHATAQAAGRRLDLLARASDRLSRSLDEQDVLDALVDLLVPEHTDWLTVLVPDGAGRLAPRRCVFADPVTGRPGPGPVPPPAIPLHGDAAAAQVFRDGEALATTDVRPFLTDPAAPPDPADLALPIDPRAGLLLPLVVRGRAVGVLSLVDRADRGTGLVGELETFADLARRAAAALDNARLFGRRVRIASRLQETLLPAALPTIPGAELAVRYTTPEEAVEVGGDLYDAVPLGGGAYLLVIGDVSGRGVDAAGATGLARHTLRAVAQDLSPAAALTRLNDVLRAQHDERFLTAVAARLALAGDGTARLTVARAGHTYPLLLRADGSTAFLRPEGPLLGPLRSVRIAEEDLSLAPGDTLMLYTDGITEARGTHDLFGEARLAATLQALHATAADRAGVGADELADRLLQAVDAFRAGPADDDVALLVLRLLPRSGPTAR